LALGNTENPDAVPPLRAALCEDPEPLVRSAAAWALGRIGAPGARKALEGVDQHREVPPVAAEVRAALAAAGEGRFLSPVSPVGVV
jgi:epoxyqueuosine reductase